MVSNDPPVSARHVEKAQFCARALHGAYDHQYAEIANLLSSSLYSRDQEVNMTPFLR